MHNHVFYTPSLPSEILSNNYLAYLQLIPNWITQTDKQGGLSILYDHIDIMGDSFLDSDNIVEPINNITGKYVNQLFNSFLNKNTNLAITVIRKIIGLGQGLTPSGDDFITGFLAFIHLNGDSLLPGSMIRSINSFIEMEVHNLTTTVSAAYLTSASQGEFSRSLYEFTHSLAVGNHDLVRDKTYNLISAGSSSGIDTILGVLFALKLKIIQNHIKPNNSICQKNY